MGRQPKSGSKTKKKPHRPPATPRSADSEEIPLDETTAALIREQLEAFRAKFGRDPEGDEPVFFDLNCDVPAPLMPEKMEEETVRAMETAGIAPQLIHAYRRTGRLVTEQNQHKLSAEAIDAWNAAVEEYFEWQAMAEEALRSGAHPAIAYAIGRTGKVMPENVELTPDGTHAIASDEDADGIESFNEYAERHPETMASEFLRGRDPGRERLH
jgi:hypothetical protein